MLVTLRGRPNCSRKVLSLDSPYGGTEEDQ
jgi:hypothetical protein